MIAPAAVNAADLTAAAYGLRRPRYRVIPETLGLAVVLLANRNTSRERAVWLADQEVSEALCGPAEAFAREMTGRPSPAGWRAGGLAGLRSLAAGALLEETAPWPCGGDGERDPVPRFWIEDDDDVFRPGWRPGPARAEVLRRLAGGSRLEDAWEAMITALHGGRASRYGWLCVWSSAHDSPERTRLLRRQLCG